MKVICCTLVFIGFANLSAQTLTQSFNEPVVGDIDKNYRLDTSAYATGLPLNATGTNCTWNFTNLAGTFPIVVDSFIAPATVPSASLFPGATFVQHRDLYTFYKSSSSPSQTELFGGYTPTLTITFTNSAIIAGYPISYGYNQTDAVSGSFRYNGSPGACNGNINVSVMGTGTVNFPNSVSIPGVLCLRSVEILTLSTGFVPFGTYNQTIYNFYMPGKKFPIVNVNYTTYNFIGNPPTKTAYVYGSNSYFTVVGINEAQMNRDNYLVFPNPFRDQLFINTKNIPEETDYLFYDVNANLVLTAKSLPDNDISALPPGMYILEIKNKQGTIHQKIFKQ